MAPRLSRLERITNLVLALLETERPLSLREIGAAVAGYPLEPAALRQAFERDKRTLRDGGIPIALARLDGSDQVGYRILAEDYYLPDLELSTDEQEALCFALAAVRLEGGGGPNLFAKLGARPIDNLPPVAVLPAAQYLGVLEQAIRSRAALTVRYHGRERVVEGYALAFRDGRWYLLGRDESAGGAVRTFRVDRIEAPPVPGEAASYEPSPDFDVARELRFTPFASARQGNDLPSTEVLLDVEGRGARPLVEAFGEQSVVARRDDGSLRLRFSVGDEEAFCAFVLGLGADAIVVAPEGLRARVIELFDAACLAVPVGTAP